MTLPESTPDSLGHAISQGEFRLHFQPQVRLSDGNVRGVEALIRWEHPELGLLPPDSFIPNAERSGLIQHLTRWVLKDCLRQLWEWREQGLELAVSANLSAGDLRDERLADYIASSLKSWAVDPSMLELEITESMVMANPPAASALLSRLKAMGIRVFLDDFGTRYSSLSYLRLLPVSGIKLDKSFVTDMAADEADTRIVRSLIDLTHGLGLQVIAEGVETRETWSLLRVHGCDMAQGFYISPAIPGDEILDWLDWWRERSNGDALEEEAEEGTSTNSDKTTRVLILEDHTLVRQSLVKTVATEPGFMVVGQAGSADEAFQSADTLRPDLALLDISLPGLDGIEFAHQLRRTNPDVRVVFLTMRDDEETIRRAVEAGADGYVTKNASTEELLDALRAVAEGSSYVSPSVAHRVMSLAKGHDRTRRAG